MPMSILDILKQYASPTSELAGDVNAHFDAVAQQVAPKDLGAGIAAALRSDVTPSFAQTIGGLFSHSDSDQKAGLLSHLFQALDPGVMGTIGGGGLGKISGSGAPSVAISAAQAAQVSPGEVATIAAQAEQRDNSIVDRVSTFYAQHPTLVKTLGVAALASVMSHLSKRPGSFV